MHKVNIGIYANVTMNFCLKETEFWWRQFMYSLYSIKRFINSFIYSVFFYVIGKKYHRV